MDIIWKIILFLFGLTLILSVARSACRVALMNYPSSEVISRAITWIIYRFYQIFLSIHHGTEGRQKCLYWFGPMFLFGSIASYFIITLFGFSFIYYVSGAEDGFITSCLASGSALSTLGFHTPGTLSGQIISIAEGGVGLGLVVFLITFIPSYQSIIQMREEKSAWLYSRTEQNPNCATLLTWISQSKKGCDLQEFWNNWEDYLRTIGDTHCDSPILLFTPSIRPGQSWLVSSLTLLDAANFSVTTLEPSGNGSARSCMEEGIYSLNRIVQFVPINPVQPERHPSALVPREKFDALCELLKSKGLTLKDNREQSWREFAENRSRYEPCIIGLSLISLLIPYPDAENLETPSPRKDLSRSIKLEIPPF